MLIIVIYTEIRTFDTKLVDIDSWCSLNFAFFVCVVASINANTKIACSIIFSCLHTFNSKFSQVFI